MQATHVCEEGAHVVCACGHCAHRGALATNKARVFCLPAPKTQLLGHYLKTLASASNPTHLILLFFFFFSFVTDSLYMLVDIDLLVCVHN